jgi:hypothetical protein
MGAALAIARGFVHDLDVMQVTQDGCDDVAARGSRFFAAVAFQWGLVADVDIESECMRWLGGLRFTVQAIIRILHLRKCVPSPFLHFSSVQRGRGTWTGYDGLGTRCMDWDLGTAGTRRD